MAGHNKWSKVKRYKEVADRRKGAAFSKVLKEITIAAKTNTDPNSNFRLRKAIEDAKALSVPKDNIDRALKKASGELEGENLEELTYEGYGPGGVAVLIECVTDNRNRTQPELRRIFEKNGGSIAEMGSVAWGFEKKGVILVARTAIDEEGLYQIALQNGADDILTSSEGYELISASAALESLRSNLEKARIQILLAELSFLPKTKVRVDGPVASEVQELLDALEDQDDVQKVVSNADFGD